MGKLFVKNAIRKLIKKITLNNGTNSVKPLTFKDEGNTEPAEEIAKGSSGVCDGQR